MNNEKQKIIPELRFPEFEDDGDWSIRSIEENIDMISGIALKSKELSDDKSGTPILRGINITEGHIRHSKEMDKFYLGDTSEISKYLVEENDIVIGMDGSKVGKNVSLVSKIDVGSILIQRVARIRAIDADIKYLYQNFISQRFRTYVDNVNTSSGIPHISSKQIRDYEIGFPPKFKEQQKIANCLSSLDDVITAETEKLDLLQDHKKGLLQQLLPQEGETQPQYRFPEFANDGDWEETTLEKCLDYLQPQPYLVSSTDYNDKYETPVLTAGKTFILGYTDEIEGIFDKNLPVIIFDDFTTASKFVNFSFKAKSSAMKILLAKDDNNIKFMFEAIQNLKFEVSTHKRHWISVYSKLKVLKPKDPNEQQKIANCLTSVDELIESQEQKIENLQAHKKGLMQQLFPNVNSLSI